MTRETGNPPAGKDHERARELAAARPDGFLSPTEEAWLDAHLRGCDPCSAVAAAFGAQRDLFNAARAVYPDAPRDLWARTAAAIESQGGSRSGSRARNGRRFGSWTLAPLAAVMVVAIAVGAGLLNGLPMRESTSKGDEPDATPFALAAGDVRVLTQGEDGSLEFRKQVVSEVCPVAAATCSLNPTPVVTQTERIAGASKWDAIISPANDQFVVVEKGDGAQAVFVVPLRDTAAAGSASPLESKVPGDTAAPPSTPASTDSAGSPTPEATATDDASASATPDESADASASPTGEPATQDPSDAASVEPTPSVDSSAAPASTRPTPSIAVTPRPDGAIEIARNVRIVGNAAAYSPDGSHFAFTAQPVNGKTGPDVYVWRAGAARAVAVTDDHSSLFSGWLGKDLLVSRVGDEGPRTYIVGLDGSETLAHDGPMWRPTVGTGRRTGVWWDGTVKATDDEGLWKPAAGALVLEPWPRGDDADRQVLAKGITDWQVEWDAKGTVLAVWTSKGGPGDPGSLSLYAIDPETGRADLESPKLDGEPAFDGFSLKTGQLTWSAPAAGGDSTVQVLAWSGDKVGRIEILTEDGTTVVR